MDSPLTQRHHDHNLVPKQCEAFFKYLSSRKTPFFSSSSSPLSPSSCFESLYLGDDNTLLNPATPHRFYGVPFSWEHLPGIPKNQISKKKESSLKLLPLPPTTTITTITRSSKKLNHEEPRIRKKNNSIQSTTSQRDPFFDAMVKCSKDDHEDKKCRNLWNDAKISRSFSNRFGFINLNSSCKRTCAVSESIVHIPSSRSTTYQHISPRSL